MFTVLKKNKILLISIAVFHFLLSWISFMKSEMINQDLVAPAWKFLTKILAFPSLYLQLMNSGSLDWFPFLMVFNSFLWSIILVTIWIFVSQQKKNRNSNKRGHV